MFTKDSILAKALTMAPLVLIATMLLIFGFGVVFANNDSPEEAMRQAREFRLKALKGHCRIIGEKVSKCYSGDKTACDALQNSISWFSGEYGQTPELACSIDDPLGFGVGRQ